MAMPNWSELSSMQLLGFSLAYILGRATIFYTLFHLLYKALNPRLGIAKDLPSKHQLRNEKIANIKANLFEVSIFFLLGISGLIRYNDFTGSRFMGTFFFCYFFFELWFYFSHRLLHTRYLRWAHRTHHVSVITNPLSALSLSLTEKFINDVGMLLIPCLLTNQLPLVVEGIIAYHLYNFYINVLGHSNIELLPKVFAKSRIGKAFTSSTYHSIHHLKGQRNFGLFLTILDRKFGTYDPSYDLHYESVVSSRGLSLEELRESKSL